VAKERGGDLGGSQVFDEGYLKAWGGEEPHAFWLRGVLTWGQVPGTPFGKGKHSEVDSGRRWEKKKGSKNK